MTNKEKWSTGIEHEIEFWKKWFDTKGYLWPEVYAFRTNPNSQLQSNIEKYLEKSKIIKILDVGSGPLTGIGKISNKGKVEISSTDALADEYKKIAPPELDLSMLYKCDTENLTKEFKKNTFDVVHASNTLDHSYDPFLCILEMFKVCKPGGILVFSHSSNEATKENGIGFHQWDFFIKNKKFYAKKFKSNNEQLLFKEIEDNYTLLDISDDNSNWCYITIRKNNL